MTRPVASASTIPGRLERAACRHPERLALVDGSLRFSYAELLDEARRAGAALVDTGLEPQAAVALWGPNSAEWALASLGAHFAGATVVPVNTRYTASEAEELIRRSRCRYVVAAGSFLGRDLAGEVAAMGTGATVISMGPLHERGSLRWADLRATGDPGSDALDERLRQLSGQDISHIQFTSGTTGQPKGARLRHQPMVCTTADWVDIVGIGDGDRYPVVAPFSHIGGHKTGLLASILAGATAYPFATFDLDGLIAAIADESMTVLQGPPTMFQGLVDEARRAPGWFRSLRVAVTGAAVIPPTLVRDMFDILGLETVITSYGLTESTGVCTITRPGDSVATIAETSGRPIPAVEVRILDSDGEAIRPGERGEIAVRGDNLMAGYLDDTAATKRAIRRGWLHTGDVGWLDQDGGLHIVDRLKDMVVVGGFNAYPAEIERAMLGHPDVAQVAVVGVADPRLGEVPAAFVVAAPGSSGSSAEIDSHCRSRLANFKIPRHVWFVEALPVNTAGKIDKRALRVLATTRVGPGEGGGSS